MKIDIYQLNEGAKKAEGLAVIIDVFRAFSLVCYMFEKGAQKIIPVGNIAIAYKIKRENPQYILVGERDNKKMPGFDFGNSPYQIQHANFAGKTVIHTTSSGTQGITNAKQASEIITGSFVNAGAIIQYIHDKSPEKVSLVCMGYATEYPIEEDTLCAEYIKTKLEGGNPDFNKMVDIIRHTSGKRFFIPKHQKHCPLEDFELCLDLNRFNFVVEAYKNEDLLYLKRL